MSAWNKTWTRSLAGLVLVAASVVVTTTPASAAVSSEAALRTAYSNGATTSIDLSADISLANCGAGTLTRNSATALTIHGNGHTVHQTCSADTFSQTGNGDLTFDDVVNVMAANNDGVDSGSGKVSLVGGSRISNVGGGDGISSGGAVTMTDASITDVGGGDGISNGTAVTLTRSSITGITDGDGISSGTTVSLTQSLISGGASQGCDDISSGDNVTLIASTLIGCDDAVSSGGNVTVTNSTITGASGDGISTGGTVTLSFATIVGNATGISSGPLNAFASVVAKSTNADCSIGTPGSTGHNFDDDGSCSFDQASDQSDAGDPGLGSIGDNGGPAPTMLPQTGSPLLDNVPSADCSQPTDERGITRPQGSGCDIGAVEVAVAGPATTTTSTTAAPATATTAAAQELPRTGSNSPTGLGALGVLLLGAGSLLLATRRRQGRSHP